ncbi:16S rRNA (guanine(527)-N(7))-methyltransferase RsmG [Oscillospiraceae bacterium PP1C4]
MIDKAKLGEYCAAMEIKLTEQQLDQFDCYAQTLVEWNQKINLTAIVKPEEIVIKHFVDSLSLLAAVKLPQGARMIDVGTGAGFPSVPIKIVRPDVNLTLLDSLNKRIVFLGELSAVLGQKNACIHFRAEEAGQNPLYRERYELATARAVAHLRELSEYCLPFVKQGGVFAALKGGEIDTEIEEASKAIELLGGKIEQVKRFSLPDESKRTIIVIKKISQTSTKYPRPSAKIAKNPLI